MITCATLEDAVATVEKIMQEGPTDSYCEIIEGKSVGSFDWKSHPKPWLK